MNRWLITPEGGTPFTVDADTEQLALIEAEDLTHWDILLSLIHI